MSEDNSSSVSAVGGGGVIEMEDLRRDFFREICAWFIVGCGEWEEEEGGSFIVGEEAILSFGGDVTTI